MNYFAVKSYIRLIGLAEHENRTTQMTLEEVNKCDENFTLVDKYSNCTLEIGAWDLPIKKPTLFDLKALISKDDIRREKRIFLKKQYDENLNMILMRKRFLKKLFPNLDDLIDEYINEEIEEK